MYADYTYYTEQFGGHVIPETAFDRWIRRAGKFIDRITFNRIKEVTADIRTACCEIAEIYYKADEHNGKEVASESVGSNSVSYAQTGKSLDQKCYEIVGLYLGHTGLMYRGVM